MAGILVATHRSYSSPDLIAIVNTEFLLFLLTAGIYLVVRGLDNIHTGITKEPRDIVYTRLQNWWKNIGHQNLRIQQLSEETASTNPLVVNTRNTREK
jgi:hypothetical protein